MNAGFSIVRTSAVQDAHGHWTIYALVRANNRDRVYMKAVTDFPTYDDYLAAIRANRPLDRPAARRAFPSLLF